MRRDTRPASAAPPTPTPTLPPPSPAPPAPNGKAAKKKKKKAKRAAGDADDDPADPDELASRALSPELDSVHVSASATLSATAVAAQAELLATANDLYRTMEDGAGPGDAVWAHLPPELRAYVRAEYAKSVRPPNMQSIVHHMEQHGWRARQTTHNSQPPFPFDAQLFADPAFALALEQLTMAGGPKSVPPPLNAPADYAEDGQYDEYYSEDEVDDNVDDVEVDVDVDLHPHAHHQHMPGAMPMPGYDAQYDYAPGESPAPAPAPAHVRTDTGGGGTKKKKKKNKKKTAAAPPPPPPPPMPAPPPPAPVARRHPRTVPPSSRAAGKQPMTFNPAPTQPVPAQPAPAPPKTRAYQPSPPSSSASAPRPPIAGAGAKLWSTNSLEERERIKEFWLGLSESERRDLVKVEREAVLKKMKEQQKHSCGCAVCGRKRYVPYSPLTRTANAHARLSLYHPPQTRTSNLNLHKCDDDAMMGNIGQRSRRNSRYCTMPITKSWNSTQTTSSGTPLREEPFPLLQDPDRFPARSSSTRTARSSTPNARSRLIRIRTLSRSLGWRRSTMMEKSTTTMRRATRRMTRKRRRRRERCSLG